MEYTVENYEAAVLQFYNNPGQVNKEIHDWLKACQNTREAWTIVWPLLQPSKNEHVQFLAANMIHHKVSRCLNEIPESEYLALKSKLVEVVVQHMSGPAPVLTRLCLTMGAFVLNTIGTVWINPLEDLGSTFSPQNFPGVPETKVIRLLVQVFCHIPEQAYSLSSVAKGQAYRALQSKGEMMYTWLFTTLNTNKEERQLVLEILKALDAWMKMICIFNWQELFPYVDSLVEFIVASVSTDDSDLTDQCLEALSAIVGDPVAHQYPATLLVILDKIIPLQNSLARIVQRNDLELACSFYGLYVAFADCHSRLVIDVSDSENTYVVNNPKNRENVMQLVKILLQCTDYPGLYPIDEIVSNLTISVWYSLVEDIQSHQSDKLKYVRLMQVYEEVYQTLAKILVKKAQYPVDFSSWNSDEKEQFRIYRQDVSDCLTYCFELRGLTMLNELVDWTEAHLTEIDKTADEAIVRWPELECLLMGIKGVAENITDETDPVIITPMTRVFGVVYRILKLSNEKKIPKLMQAGIECISSCSGMLSMYEPVLKNVIAYVLEGLFQPEIATSAALAVKTLGRDCSKSLADYTPQILSSCKQALVSGSLSPVDCNRVVFSVGKFLPYLPDDQIISAVNEIFAPCFTQLQSLAMQEAKPEIKTQVNALLNIFSTLCLSLDVRSHDDDNGEIQTDSDGAPLNNNVTRNPNLSASRPQPLIPVVEQLLPVLIPVTERWIKDEEVIESLFTILKHTLSTIHSASQTVLQYCMQLVLLCYRLHPLPYATGVAKQTILMLGRENRETQCQFLGEMHRLCLDRLKDTGDTEFTESYFTFIAQLLKSDCDLVNLSRINLDVPFTIAIDCLNVPEINMVKASIFLLMHGIDKATSLAPPRKDFFKDRGPTIVQKVLSAIGYIVARPNCQYFGDIILMLNKHFPAEWRKWLTDCLNVQGFPSTHATQEHKTQFYIRVTKERVNKRVIQDAIGEFAVACRNIAGSEYAAATSKRLV